MCNIYICPMCKGRKQIDKIKHNLWSPGDESFFCDCTLCEGKGFVVDEVKAKNNKPLQHQ